MLIKVAILFVIFMMVVGMVGKLRLPKFGTGLKKTKKCQTCGSFLIGTSPCNCQTKS